MSENKCCGNCKHFKDEDAEGWGWCTFNKTNTHCAQSWDCHNSILNGWTEITPDNIDEIDVIDPNRVVIATIIDDGIILSSVRTDCDITLKACSELGGYYYYVLPELKIE